MGGWGVRAVLFQRTGGAGRRQSACCGRSERPSDPTGINLESCDYSDHGFVVSSVLGAVLIGEARAATAVGEEQRALASLKEALAAGFDVDSVEADEHLAPLREVREMETAQFDVRLNRQPDSPVAVTVSPRSGEDSSEASYTVTPSPFAR
jgi:hypothetical protein